MDENKTLEEIYYKAEGYLANPVKITEIVKAKKLNERNFVILTNNLVKKGKLAKVDFGIFSITESGIAEVESRVQDSFITRKQQERKQFLKQLYDMSGGDVNARFDFKEVGVVLEIPEERSSYITELLSQRGLIDNQAGSIAITQEGIKLL